MKINATFFEGDAIIKVKAMLFGLRHNCLTILIIFSAFSVHSQEINFDWIKSFGDIGNDVGNSLTIDNEGNLIQSGYFNNNPVFVLNGDTISISSNGEDDIFLKKFTNEGELIWANNYGGSGKDRPSQILIDNNDDIYMIGSFSEQIIFDSINTNFQFTSKGITDIFFGKWDAHGGLLWIKQMGGTLEDVGTALTSDNQGDIYITGYFQGNCDFNLGIGNATLDSNGANDTFFAKFDSNGIFLWVKQLNGPLNNEGRSILINDNQEIVLCGSFEDLIDVDPSVNQKFDNRELILWK